MNNKRPRNICNAHHIYTHLYDQLISVSPKIFSYKCVQKCTRQYTHIYSFAYQNTSAADFRCAQVMQVAVSFSVRVSEFSNFIRCVCVFICSVNCAEIFRVYTIGCNCCWCCFISSVYTIHVTSTNNPNKFAKLKI